MATFIETQSRLERLPLETLHNTVEYLTPHDIFQLSRCSKAWNTLAEPLLWTSLEFHRPGYHNSPAELHHPPPFRDPSKRLYHDHTGRRATYGWTKAKRLFTMLDRLQRTNPDRARVLAGRVRHLCADLAPLWRPDPESVPVWHLLPCFYNLESLELHGSYLDVEEGSSDSVGPPPPLRFAKLFKYIPRSLAAWVLRAGPTLERLELGMLDRPISNIRSRRAIHNPIPDDALNSAEDSDSDHGSLLGQWVIPRPLGGFLSGVDSVQNPTGLVLPKLKHLYLCQPTFSTSFTNETNYSWSSRAEVACIVDWQKLLLASSASLETLVLEQRLASEGIEVDHIEPREWMIICVEPAAHYRLMNMVMEVMDKPGLGALTAVYLYGMDYADDGNLNATDKTRAGQLLQLLKQRDIRAEARVGTWCMFNADDGKTTFGEWYSGKDDYGDEDEDLAEEYKIRKIWDTLLVST